MDKEMRRQELYGLLGDLPPKSLSISSEKIAEKEYEHYVLESWVFDWNGEEPVSGYFVRPTKWKEPFPTILFNHSHGGNHQLGKEELIQGNVYLQDSPYAEELSKMGYAAFCIDAWSFGSRSGRSESELFKEMLWHGQLLWGKMVYDTLRAIDYLVSRPDVDASRIGAMGISMGSVMSWWAAALEPRIKVCVDICGMIDFHSLVENRALDLHSIYFYVPGLLKHFTTTEINALIAPRPHLCLAGNSDSLVPSHGLDKVDTQLKNIYLEHGRPEAWRMRRFDAGHEETKGMRMEVKSFLNQWL